MRFTGHRALATALLAAGVVAAATQPSSAAVRPPKLQYEMLTLPNGLTLVLSEDHSTPIVHLNLTYHVGSKNEKPGKTGFAHLFEHLMFKGRRTCCPRRTRRMSRRSAGRATRTRLRTKRCSGKPFRRSTCR